MKTGSSDRFLNIRNSLLAIATDSPEQNTNSSAAEEKPNRAGMNRNQLLAGTCATKMMNIDSPRTKSRRTSRTGFALAVFRIGADLPGI